MNDYTVPSEEHADCRGDEPEARGPEQADPNTIFNKAEALERAAGDEELLEELITLYLEDSVGMVDTMRDALERGDMEAVAGTAHTLKGSSANLSAKEVQEAAHRLEAAAKNGDSADARVAFKALEDCLANVLAVFRSIVE